MYVYIIRRLLQAIPILLLVSLGIFLLMRSVPGDPAKLYLGGVTASITQEDIEKVRKQFGLDKPLIVQYGIWVKGLLSGDMGRSYFFRRPVSKILSTTLPVTMELALFSLPIAVICGVAIGMFTAIHRGTIVDYGATVLTLFGLSMPDFWLAILLILVFSVKLGWLPSVGYVSFVKDPLDNLRHLVLPGITMGMILTAPFMRFTRSSMLEILPKEYLQVARAKGLPEKSVLYKHALRNALIPITTLLGLYVALFFGGAAIVETVFALPGIGRALVTAISQRDYNVIQDIVVMVGAAYIFVNIMVDILYVLIDPRIVYD